MNLSVVIISFNEERNIGRCIDSVRWIADEMIVLDSYSTDDTVAIARQKGAIIKQEPFTGYIQQKNRALHLTKFNNVLSLDADEAISIELANAILEAKRHSNYKAFTMIRCNCFCGRFIRHGLWYPDKQLRLFDKRIATWGGRNPHGSVVLLKNTPVKHLDGEILHYAYYTQAQCMERNDRISTIAAESLFSHGQKLHWSMIVFSPLWTFINGYFLRLGLLEGYFGLLVALYTANQRYLKYLKLHKLQRQVPTAKSNQLTIQQRAKAAL